MSKGAYKREGLYPRGPVNGGAYIRASRLINGGVYIRGSL